MTDTSPHSHPSPAFPEPAQPFPPPQTAADDAPPAAADSALVAELLAQPAPEPVPVPEGAAVPVVAPLRDVPADWLSDDYLAPDEPEPSQHQPEEPAPVPTVEGVVPAEPTPEGVVPEPQTAEEVDATRQAAAALDVYSPEAISPATPWVTDSEGRQMLSADVPFPGALYPGRVVMEGCEGNEVMWVQGRLNAQLVAAALPISGEFDKPTRQAVYEFQRLVGFRETGIVDQATQERLAG